MKARECGGWSLVFGFCSSLSSESTFPLNSNLNAISFQRKRYFISCAIIFNMKMSKQNDHDDDDDDDFRKSIMDLSFQNLTTRTKGPRKQKQISTLNRKKCSALLNKKF